MSVGGLTAEPNRRSFFFQFFLQGLFKRILLIFCRYLKTSSTGKYGKYSALIPNCCKSSVSSLEIAKTLSNSFKKRISSRIQYGDFFFVNSDSTPETRDSRL